MKLTLPKSNIGYVQPTIDPSHVQGLFMTKGRAWDCEPAPAPDMDRKINLQTHSGLFPASMKRPFRNQETTTPQNVGYVANLGFDSIISLNPSKPTARFYAQVVKHRLTYIEEEELFIKDGFRPEELPPQKIDRIVRVVNLFSNPIIYCGAGDGRSGVVKAAYTMRLMDENCIISNESWRERTIKTYLDNNLTKRQIENIPATTAVYYAVKNIRRDHPEAIERPNDVKVLNEYHKYLEDCILENMKNTHKI